MGPYSKAIVLGASGFLGVALTRELVSRGLEVVCFAGSRSSEWPSGCRFIPGDFSRPNEELLREMDGAYIFHLLHPTRPGPSTENTASEIEKSVLPSIHYLEKTKDFDCRWVYVSSGGTVYGQTDVLPIPETHPTRPINSYGLSKVMLESYFGLYHLMHGCDVVTARLSNPYGAWPVDRRPQGLVATTLLTVHQGRDLQIWGDGETVRDYIYIRDAIDGLMAAALKGGSGQIYNIGTGEGLSINNLVSRIQQILGTAIKVYHVSERGVDVRANILDIGKIYQDCGWKPSTSLQRGLEETAAWFVARSAAAAERKGRKVDVSPDEFVPVGGAAEPFS